MTKIIKPPGPQRPYPEPTKSGKVPFQYANTKGETKYWLWGNLSTSKTPLIVLHGGPGIPHNYVLSFSLIYQDYGIPVLMYDQIGCGESTRFPEKKGDDSFWTPALFMAELDNIKSALKIKTFDLLGQSWGGMLAGQYAIEKQPKGLRKLIICDSPSDMIVWVKVAARLRAALPKEVRETLDRCEKEGTTDSPEYQKASMVYLNRHMCRLDPWPAELQAAFDALEGDNTVYMTMNGPNEFHVIGNLKNWSITEELALITEKTVPGGLLVMNGYFDEAQDETTQAFFEKPSCKTRWIRYALSSHLPFIEECETLMLDLGRFLMA